MKRAPKLNNLVFFAATILDLHFDITISLNILDNHENDTRFFCGHGVNHQITPAAQPATSFKKIFTHSFISFNFIKQIDHSHLPKKTEIFCFDETEFKQPYAAQYARGIFRTLPTESPRCRRVRACVCQ